MRKLCASILVCIHLSAAAVLAQPMSVDREKVLGTFGSVNAPDIPVRAIKPGPGVVFTRTVRHDGAQSIRLHFTVTGGGESPFWSVAVIGTDGRRWEYRPDSGETEFWSDEFAGDNVAVELRSTEAAPPVTLTIDRTAGTVRPTVPKSITGADEREAWDLVSDPVRTLGASVVRLRFVDDVQNRVFVCTGWLAFSNRHLLTNDHCINTEPEARSALADVDYTQEGALPRSVRLRRVLMHDARLDFSLLELSEPLDRAPLKISGAVAADEPLVIIQHPAGEPKQISRRGCLVAETSVNGVTADLTDFEHACDTLGGSSGSPVLDASTFTVVGLHHLGFLAGDKPVNRAVKIDQVIAAVRAKFPDLVP